MKLLPAIGVGIFLLGTGAGQAADLAAGSVVPFVATPAAFDWNGPYFGVNGGGAWGSSRWTSGGVTTGDFDIDGGMAGITAGYDWAANGWVIGVVADVDWADISGDTPSLCSPNCETGSDWLATLRGRIGKPIGRALPYVTAGLAVGEMTAQFVGGFSGKDRSTEAGWTAGAGVEYGLAQGWSAWVEYLYAQLNDGSCRPTVCVGPPAATDVKFAVSMVRVGINRRW